MKKERRENLSPDVFENTDTGQDWFVRELAKSKQVNKTFVNDSR